ncbi:MAG TPA: hypothetical protein GX701_01275 [Clostridiales bacterium]|nr:hypothetical protein [Clostridiales bacterium]
MGADAERQFTLGKQLRHTTDRLNVPCVPFNRVDVIRTPNRSLRWKPFPRSFQEERRAYVENRPYGEYVLVHGDLCPDNVLVPEEVVLIDYAAAALAPKSTRKRLRPFTCYIKNCKRCNFKRQRGRRHPVGDRRNPVKNVFIDLF